MNVMAQAHKLTKARIAAGTVYTYAELMKRHLIQAHKEYKAQCATVQTAFRNLYKITNKAGKVLAHVTAQSDYAAIDRYTLASPDFEGFQEVKAEQISFGYPQDECKIY